MVPRTLLRLRKNTPRHHPHYWLELSMRLLANVGGFSGTRVVHFAYPGPSWHGEMDDSLFPHLRTGALLCYYAFRTLSLSMRSISLNSNSEIECSLTMNSSSNCCSFSVKSPGSAVSSVIYCIDWVSTGGLDHSQPSSCAQCTIYHAWKLCSLEGGEMAQYTGERILVAGQVFLINMIVYIQLLSPITTRFFTSTYGHTSRPKTP